MDLLDSDLVRQERVTTRLYFRAICDEFCCAVPTKELNKRKVVVSTKDLTLDARFTIASELRQQAASRQSQGRENVLAQKRGLASTEKPAKQQVQFLILRRVTALSYRLISLKLILRPADLLIQQCLALSAL